MSRPGVRYWTLLGVVCGDGELLFAQRICKKTFNSNLIYTYMLDPIHKPSYGKSVSKNDKMYLYLIASAYVF